MFYKVSNKADGEDILQSVYLTAFAKFDTLGDKNKFKPWILTIAQNLITDYYRSKAKALELPLDESISYETSFSRIGLTVNEIVSETLSSLAENDKQILYLYFIRQKPQREIAEMLGIPLGTVKSRLHTAKRRFIEKYPYPPALKGEKNMTRLPDIMPDVKIVKSNKPVFDVVWEEAMGWFIIPRVGEKISWAIYDYPQKTLSDAVELKAIGKAMVHGIEGVEIVSTEINLAGSDDTTSPAKEERTLVMQLTDTHCRYLLESHYEGDVKHTSTFLDEDFLVNWGYGEDNCGKETHVAPKGVIFADGDSLTCKAQDAIDAAGRYEVTLGGKTYDTILIANIESSKGLLTHTYIDENGRTVLWRRFNKDDWAYNRYKQKWSEKLPQNDKVYVNGDTYIHWYDCITDYVI